MAGQFTAFLFCKCHYIEEPLVINRLYDKHSQWSSNFWWRFTKQIWNMNACFCAQCAEMECNFRPQNATFQLLPCMRKQLETIRLLQVLIWETMKYYYKLLSLLWLRFPLFCSTVSMICWWSSDLFSFVVFRVLFCFNLLMNLRLLMCKTS